MPVLLQWCAVPGVPFIVDANSTKQVKLTGQAPKVAQWLLSSLLMCPVMPAASELEGLQETLMQEAETATLGNCRQQLLEATEMERSLMQNADVSHEGGVVVQVQPCNEAANLQHHTCSTY